MKGSPQQACADARASDLFWRANQVHRLATVARDAMGGERRDLARAEKVLAEIAVLAGGGAA